MYANFYMPKTLPNVEHATNFQRCLLGGNYLMIASLAIVLCCLVITFALDHYFSLPAQVAAHITTTIFAALFKIGYVLRCVGLHGLGIKSF